MNLRVFKITKKGKRISGFSYILMAVGARGRAPGRAPYLMIWPCSFRIGNAINTAIKGGMDVANIMTNKEALERVRLLKI